MGTTEGFVKSCFQAAFKLGLAALLCAFAFAPAVSAQTSTTGKVIGTVSDPTGAIVPKAEVQLINVGTNAGADHADGRLRRIQFSHRSRLERTR